MSIRQYRTPWLSRLSIPLALLNAFGPAQVVHAAENECATLNTMEWDASSATAFDNTQHTFNINHSSAIVLSPFGLTFTTTGDLMGSFTDPSCAMSTFAPDFVLSFSSGTNMDAYLSIDQSTGQVTFDVPSDDFSTLGSGIYRYYAKDSSGTIQTASLKLTFEVVTSCASTSFDTMATPNDMTTAAADGISVTQQLAMTKDYESGQFGSQDGFAYCGARESFLTDVKDADNNSITQSFISVDQASGLITLNSATLSDAGIYTAIVKQCLKEFPSICTSDVAFAVDITSSHCSVLIQIEWDATTQTLQNRQYDFDVNVDTSAQAFQGVIEFTTEDLSGTQYIDDPCTATDFTITWSFVRDDAGALGSFISFDSSTGAVSIQVGTDEWTAISNLGYTYTASTTHNSTPFSTSGLNNVINVFSSCDTAPTTFNAWGGSLTDLNIEAGLNNADSISFVIQTDTQSDTKANQDGLTYCGARTMTVVIKDSSATVVASPAWLSVTTDATQHTISAQSSDLADVGVYDAFVSTCLDGFPSICSTEETFQINIIPCQVTSITEGTPTNYIMYIDNGSFTVNQPTFTQVPACGYAIDTMTLASVANPFIETDNGDGTWTFNEIIQRVRHGDVGNLDWTLTLLNCHGVCTHTFTRETITATDLCESTVLAVANPFPTTMSCVEAGAQVVYSFLKFTDSVGDAKGDPNYCGNQVYSVVPSSFLSINGLTLELQSTSLNDFENHGPTFTATFSAGFQNWTPVLSPDLSITVTIQCWSVINVLTQPADQTMNIGDPLVINFPTYSIQSCTDTLVYSVAYLNLDDSTTGTLDSSTTTVQQVTIDLSPGSEHFTIENYDTSYDGKSIQLTVTASNSGLLYSNSDVVFKVTFVDICPTSTINNPNIPDQQTTVLLLKQVDLATTDTVSDLYIDPNDSTPLCGSISYLVTIQDAGNREFSTYTTSAHLLDITPDDSTYIDIWTVTVQSYLTNYPAVQLTSTFQLTVDPCVVISLTKTGTSDNAVYTTYNDGLQSYNVQTLAQTPACGYTEQYLIVKNDGTPAPTFTGISGFQYTVDSNDLADVNTYTCKIEVIYTDYPASYTHPTLYSDDFTITIENPCDNGSTALEAFSIPSSMTTSELLGTPVTQYFTQPTDTISRLHDPAASYTHYVLVDQVPTYNAVQAGAGLCGPRQYSVSASCTSFLSVDTSTADKPFVSILSNSVTEQGTYSCTLDATLANHASVAAQTSAAFTVIITDCEIVSFTKDTPNPASLVTYILGGTGQKVTLPTYTQVPACQYPLSYTCNAFNHITYASWYPVGDSNDADPQNADSANVAQLSSDCTVAGTTDVTYDIKQFDSSTNLDLSSYQYQGDYAIQIVATAFGEPNSVSDSSFTFILRVINPCIYKTFNTELNYMTIVTAFSDYATSVLNANDALETQTQPMFTDWASENYGNKNGYTLCGGHTYGLQTSYAWYTLTQDSTARTLTGVIDATLTSEINYVGFTTDATRNTCWNVEVVGSITAFPQITLSYPFLACIEECEPTAFSMDPAATTAFTYTVSDPAATFTIPTWTQTPACGYAIVYTAKLSKTAPDTSSWVSDPTFELTTIDAFNAVSGVTFDDATNTVQVYTTDRATSGTYNVEITATLQETKYNAALNINSEVFTLTILDECTATVLNNVTPASLNVVFQNMQTSIIAAPVVQSYAQIVDTKGLQKGCADNSLSNDLSCYTAFCGSFTVTMTTYTWLSLDQTAQTITIQSNNPADMNYSPNGDGSAYGHKVDITICLDDYTSICATPQTIWVKIGECTVTSLTPVGIQADISHTIFSTVTKSTVISYTQTPGCGWTYDILATEVGGVDVTAWLTYDSVLNQWVIQSIDTAHEGEYTIRQTIQLQDTKDGMFEGTSNSDILFKITMINPCKLASNQIIPQNGAGETFDFNNDHSWIYLLQTSVLYGIDTDPNGVPVTFDFLKHDDLISQTYRSTSGLDFCCGPRYYRVEVIDKSTNDYTRLGTFAKIFDVPGSDTEERISIYTWDDLDIGEWRLKITVQLFNYLNQVPQINEYAWVNIESCIVNNFYEGVLSPSKQAVLSGYNSLTDPFMFQIFADDVEYMELSTYVLSPNCSYPIIYEFVVDTYPSSTAPNNFLASFNVNANPLAGFQSEDPTLDQAEYGAVDPITGLIDYTQPLNKNPYLVTYRAYIQDYNPASLVFENKDRQLYIWPFDPCNAATLYPDNNINAGAPIIYFLGDISFNPVEIQFSKDSISLNPLFSGTQDPLGNENCEGRKYSIIMENTEDLSNIASIDGEPLLVQEISVYTINEGDVGQNVQRVKSCLIYYEHICAYATFTVQVHMVVLPEAIEDQYYQIQAPDLVFSVGTFTLVPPNPDYTISYTIQVLKQGVAQYPPPSWVTFNEKTMLMTISTTDVAVEGNWTVCLLGKPFDGIYEYGMYANLSYTQTMSLRPPPIQIKIPPEFITFPEDQTFEAGKSFYYQLPVTFSTDGHSVTVNILSSYNWLQFDQSSNSLSVAAGATGQEHIGNYLVQIELVDAVGAKRNYIMGISITESSDLLLALEQEQKRVSLLPVPKLEPPPTERGVVTIKWDKAMKLPRNLTLVQEAKTTWFFAELGEVRVVPALDIQVTSGGETLQEDLEFTWYFISWKSTEIQIQLVFTDPYKVSYNPDKDSVKVTFYQTSFFTDTMGAPVKAGPEGSVISEFLPPQIPHKDIPVEEDVIGAGEVLGDMGQVIMQLVISYFLNNLWSMISTQQIIVMIPLFEISLPVVTGEFFKFLMEVAAFDIIPTDDIFTYMFQVDPPDALSENFAQVGFETTYFFFNLGSLVIALFSFPFQVIISYILKQFSSAKSLMRVGLQMERNLYWNNQIVIFNSSYVILIVCAMIQMTALEWDNGYGPWIFSFFAIFYGILCIIFPFFQLLVAWWNFNRLEERSFQKRFGALWEGMDTSHKGFLSFNFWFIARRFQMGLLVVAFRGILFYQISGLVFQTLIAMIVAGEAKPYSFKRANKMEFFNEIMILMILYNVMCLTEFQPNLEVQDVQGIIMIFCVLFHIGFNLTLMIIDEIDNVRMRWKRYRLLRRYAKTRGEKNRSNQKKKRHEKWQKMIDEIKEKKRQAELAEQQRVVEDYDMAQVSNSAGSNAIDLSQSDDEANVNRADFSKQPLEAPQVMSRKILEFADESNQTNTELNNRLGSRRKLDAEQNFLQNVHKDISKPIPLDVVLDDPTQIMANDQPGEWQQKQIFKHARLEAGQNGEKLNELQVINNKIGRMAQQDNNHEFKTNKVVPLKRSEQVLRVVANAEAIHGKLFQQHEKGDGPKRPKKKKPIVPKVKKEIPTFTVPVPRELAEQMAIDEAAKQLGLDTVDQPLGPKPNQNALPEISKPKVEQIIDDFDFEDFDVDANKGL